MMEKTETQFTIGRLAEETGLSRKSIRYYEKEKLIPKAERSRADYRLYKADVIVRLRFIQKAKAIGYSLDEIRQILTLSQQGKSCCDRAYAWSEQKLSELDEQIRFLKGLRGRLQEHREQWKRQRNSRSLPEADICGLIESVDLKEVIKKVFLMDGAINKKEKHHGNQKKSRSLHLRMSGL